MNKPYTLINIATTADGKMDTFERKGFAISSKRDMERVGQLRAECVARWPAPNPVKIGTPPSQIFKKESMFLSAGSASLVIFTVNRTSKDQLEALCAPEKIHLCDVYRSLGEEDVLAMHDHPNKHCPIDGNIKGALENAFSSAQVALVDSLSRHTIADVLRDVRARAGR